MKRILLHNLVFSAFVLLSAPAFAQPGVCGPLQPTTTLDCVTGTVQLDVDSSYTTYTWSPAAGLSNPNIQNPVASVSGTYSVSATYLGPNMIINPDFAAGNTGFTSGQTYTTTYSPCNYYVGAQWFATFFPGLTDHTPTTDNMFMHIDGCTTPTMLWEEGAFTIVPGADYQFYFWATEAGATQPTFEIHFIGDVTGDNIIASIPGIPAPTNSTWAWDQYGIPSWNAGPNSSVTIRIINLQTQGYGNDFGMDDFEFRRFCTNTDTVQVIVPPPFTLGPDTALCHLQNLVLNAGPANSYLWSTGDTTQTINPAAPGVYWVSIDNGICVVSDTITISPLPPQQGVLGADLALCDVLSVTLDAGPATSYLWNTGDTTQTIVPATAGLYWVTAVDGICVMQDTIAISPLSLPGVLGPDVSLCDALNITLDAGAATGYLWSTGETTQTISPAVAGVYWVSASNGICVMQDTVVVTGTPAQPVELGADISLCDYFSVTLDAGPGNGYLWSTGETTQTITPTAAGVYSVTVTNGSCTTTDMIELTGAPGEGMLYIPNTFTPGGDALNDKFLAYALDVGLFSMRIFNRWGELIFETTDISQGWDGTYKGKIVQEDTYVYVIDYRTTCDGAIRKKTGHVNVIR